MRIAIQALIIVLLLSRVVMAEQSTPSLGRVEVEPPLTDLAELLWRAALSDKLFAVPVAERSVDRGDLEYRQFFLGNQSKYDSEVTEITLRFGVDSAAEEGAEQSPEVEVLVVIERKGEAIISFKHSRPRGRTVSAVSMRGQALEERRLLWLFGQDSSSLFVFIPRLLPRDILRGFLICPRDIATARLFTKNILKETNYRLLGFSAKFEGVGQAKLLTGRGVGMADIRLATTQNVLKPTFLEDRSYSANPVADLFYRPDQEPGIVIEKFDQAGAAALQIATKLHYPVGYKRETIFNNYVWIKEVTVPRGPALIINPQTRSFEVTPDAGRCYSVVYQYQQFVHNYSKEELQLPDWVSADPIE